MVTFNKNMLSPGGFTFSIKKLPEFNDFVQSVSVPGIQTSPAEQPTPFISIPKTGDHGTFGDLTVNFKINEDMGNYIEIFNWLIGITFPEEFEQYRLLVEQQTLTGEGVYSDATLLINSSAKNPIIQVKFVDLHPVGLSGFDLDVKDTNIEYVDATASFRFRRYFFSTI